MKAEERIYYDKHRNVIQQMKRDAISSVQIQRSIRKMFYDCPCGATVGCKNLDLHFISAKHRAVCGDIV